MTRCVRTIDTMVHGIQNELVWVRRLAVNLPGNLEISG